MSPTNMQKYVEMNMSMSTSNFDICALTAVIAEDKKDSFFIFQSKLRLSDLNAHRGGIFCMR